MTVSYSAGPTETPLLGETIGQNLERMTVRHPDREAVVVPFQGIRATYAEFNAAVDRLARSFLSLDVDVGDRVGHLELRTAPSGSTSNTRPPVSA